MPFAVMLCVLGGVAQAADGVLLVTKTTTTGSEPRTNQVQIESKRMRAESTGATGEKMIVLFDGTKQVMRLIDNEKKTYTEMTKEDVDAIGGQMSAMMAQMEQQLKSLPPEQRAQVEAMMKGRGMGAGAAVAPKVQYKKVGTDTVGKWTCDKDRGIRGRQEDVRRLHRGSEDARVHRGRLRHHARAGRLLREADAGQRGAGLQHRRRRRAGVQRDPGEERGHRRRATGHDRSDRGHPSDVP